MRLPSFRRITTSGVYLPELDGLRFIAIALVVIYHLIGYLKTAPSDAVLHWIGQYGRYGVHLFFAISGFILALPFARQHMGAGRPVSLRKYFVRRLTRLEPPFLINILLCWLGIRLLGQHTSPTLVLTTASYTYNLTYGGMSPVNPVTWSLEMEVQFYCAAPLLAQVFRLRPTIRRSIIVAVMLASALLHSALPEFSRLSMTLPAVLGYFGAGLLLADFYVTGQKGPSFAFDLLGALGWGLVVVAPLTRWPHLIMPVGILAAYSGALHGRLLRAVLKLGPIATVGGMCYTIYLYHYQVIAAAGRYLHWDFWPAFGALLTIVLAGSAFWYLVLEKPCMDPAWPQRFFQAFRPVSVGSAESATLPR